MPTYHVIKEGFFGGRLYGGNSRRQTLEVDKPFTEKNPKPKWVGDEVDKPTPAEKKLAIPVQKVVESHDAPDSKDKEVGLETL